MFISLFFGLGRLGVKDKLGGIMLFEFICERSEYLIWMYLDNERREGGN